MTPGGCGEQLPRITQSPAYNEHPGGVKCCCEVGQPQAQPFALVGEEFAGRGIARKCQRGHGCARQVLCGPACLLQERTACGGIGPHQLPGFPAQSVTGGILFPAAAVTAFAAVAPGGENDLVPEFPRQRRSVPVPPGHP